MTCDFFLFSQSSKLTTFLKRMSVLNPHYFPGWPDTETREPNLDCSHFRNQNTNQIKFAQRFKLSWMSEQVAIKELNESRVSARKKSLGIRNDHFRLCDRGLILRNPCKLYILGTEVAFGLLTPVVLCSILAIPNSWRIYSRCCWDGSTAA